MDTYRKLLDEFIAFKSISTDPAYKGEIDNTVKWLEQQFQYNNFKTKILRGYGNPIFFAEYEVDPAFETVLIYGHYDVQPALEDNGWDGDPFKVIEKDGKLIARGIVDNKGQTLIHIATIFDLINENNLKYNVKFMIEGDEETGGELTSKALEEHVDLFQADFVLISDGEMPYKPVITASFRGVFNMSIIYQTADNNLHSGLYGGGTPNAAEELARLITKLHDEKYNSTIPGFEDDIIEMTKDEVAQCKHMDIQKEATLDHTGIKNFFTGKYNSFSARIGFESMYTVTGLKAGYIHSGYSNIVPSKAEAKINFRLAADQDPMSIYDLFRAFVEKNTPEYVDVTFTEPESIGMPIKIDLSSAKHQESIRLLEEIYGDEVLVDYCGAAIPIVVDMKRLLKTDPLLISLGNDDCNMHGVNENFDIGLLEKGLVFSRKFLGK